MKRIIGRFFICFLVFLAFVVNVPNSFSNIAYAENAQDNLNYVSLGDSIAAGYGLDGYSEEASIVSQSYVYLYQNGLKERYSDINAISFAKSGATTADLITNLEDETVISALQKADVITICIGANDILGPASAGLVDYVMKDKDITVDLAEGLEVFSQNFPIIIGKLNELNKDAQKVFMTVYNPYKELINATHDVSISAGTLINVTIAQEKLIGIGSIAETYISGNKEEYTSGNSASRVYGLNERMKGFIEGKNVVDGSTVQVDTVNCYLVDVKSAFDSYIGEERIVSADILDYEMITTTYDSIQSEISTRLDPHPTEMGHSVIGEIFINHLTNDLVLVNFDFNGGLVESVYNNITIIQKSSVAIEPMVEPERAGYKFKGWCVEISQQNEDWIFSSVVDEDLTLKAKWIEAYTVAFDTKGGASAIESQYLEAGDKVERPVNPLKSGSSDVFAGWYYVGENEEVVFWDFDEDTISGDLTLIAKWVNSICSDNTLLIQNINNLKPVTFTIDIEANIQWYVNGEIVEGENLKQFIYTPPEEADEYIVYCIVNGVETRRHTIVVNYIIPESITIDITTISDNVYTFAIENGKYIDGSKCSWYATVDQFSDEAVLIGEGVTCTTELTNNCKVFAVYNNQELVSNYIEVDPPVVMETNVYLIVGVAIGIAVFVLLLTVLSRKRYKDYY